MKTAFKSVTRFVIRQIILLGWLVLALPVWARESPVRLEVIARNDSHQVILKNGAPAAMSVIVELSGTNLSSDRVWPQVLVINPGVTMDLGTVRGADPHLAYRFNTRLFSQIGDYRAHDISDATYRLPYPDGEAYPMTQAYGGPLTSHSDPLMQQAIDFTMPEGTLVVAARDGVVVSVEDSFTAGGIDSYYLDKANQVGVQHVDGTVAVYVHLFPRSVKVVVGQHVKAGEVLAKSGNTGFSSGPHLHFALMRPKLGTDNVFRLEALPVHFVTGLPQRILVPVAGLLATAASDRPANVVYQTVARERWSPDAPSLQPPPPHETLAPLSGDKPVLDTQPRLGEQRGDASRRFWLRFAIGAWCAVFVCLYFFARFRRSRQFYDE